MSRARRGTRKRSAVGSFFFLTGCLTVLGGTFAAGIAADRWWLHQTAVRAAAGTPVARDTEKPARRGGGRMEERPSREAAPTPVLTFYQDLTAPLTAPPPRERPRAEKTAAVDKPAEKTAADKPADRIGVETPDRGADTAPAGDNGPKRYTVQVAAFNLRSQAETLRATLANAGLEAYVTENEAGGTSRYRVRIGDYATRDAARQAAQHLANERRLSTYVTVR